MDSQEANAFAQLSATIARFHAAPPPSETLPSQTTLANAREKLISHLPTEGQGLDETIRHLCEDLSPALNNSSRSPNYYGFVTGGLTPAAALADNLVTAHDQNVQVHLPNETISTEVEDRALAMLCELLDFDPNQWTHRTFTTGATASNLLGVACGREFVIAEASAQLADAEISVGEIGIIAAMRKASIDEIQILTTVPHSSLSKVASILGLGRTSVKCIGRPDAPHEFDMALLRQFLEQPKAGSIVAISASEVNTGLFATTGLKQMQELRNLCDIHGAWIHVDGAFGILGRALEDPKYDKIIQACIGLDLADSIAGDGHKLLNVPYDCGFYLSRHRNIAERVFKNPNAAYLASGDNIDNIMSPLNIGLENSRRFRALPVYANFVAYGKSGYRRMLERQVDLSRGIARLILETSDYELLPGSSNSAEDRLDGIYIIVLFRAKDEKLNAQLVDKIKASRKVYVSGTSWDGKPACRFAVSNWSVNVERDLTLIKLVLQDIVAEWKSEA